MTEDFGDISVEFSFGGVTMEPAGNLLAIECGGIQTYIDPKNFNNLIREHVLGENILDLATAEDVFVLGDKSEHPEFSARSGMPYTLFENSLVKLLNSESVDAACGVPDFILSQFISDLLVNLKHLVDEREKWFGRGPGATTLEANFDLYVDGYTIKSTGKVGEMLVTSPEGKSTVIPTKKLTAFLDRRLTPGESDANIEPLPTSS